MSIKVIKHEEVGYGSDLEMIVSQWENLRMGPVMAHWKSIDFNINNT
jgi:hypothetical protein